MSKRKRTGLIVGAVALWLIIFLSGVFSCFDSYATVSNPLETDLSDWMRGLSDTTLLKEAVIPGAHDAGTKGMAWLGETQNLDFGDQLACGVRYFDIRIRKKGGKHVLFHGPINGMKAEPIFAEFARFLQDHPTEILILDFQHFDGSEEYVYETVKEKLGDYLISSDGSDGFIDSLTIGDARGKCLIFWGAEDKYCADNGFIFLRGNDGGTREGAHLHSYYFAEYNEKPSADYIGEGLPIYIDMYARGGKSGLFVLQGQLTDKVRFRGPKFREAQHADNMSEYISALKSSEALDKINIIIRDYVNSRKCEEIIALNGEKGNFAA